ncbi:MAG: glycosyltransferase [Clostridia bacterium]|nr:glycosyltransferase [Clostridia bacterium]
MSAVQQPWLSIVIPTYGRAKSLGQHITAVHACLGQDFPGQRFEIIVVNDASPDQTHVLLADLTARCPTVRVLNLAQNLGQQAATLAGLALAEGSVVVTMDDDGKDAPADVVRLVGLLSAGYDVVYGVPEQEKDLAWHRRLGTTVKEGLLGSLCKKPKGIRLTGFRAMNRATVDRIVADKRRHVYISATILEKPVRIGQVQVAAPVRNASGYSLATLARLLLRIAIWYGPIDRLRIRPATPHPLQQRARFQNRARISPETPS